MITGPYINREHLTLLTSQSHSQIVPLVKLCKNLIKLCGSMMFLQILQLKNLLCSQNKAFSSAIPSASFPFHRENFIHQGLPWCDQYCAIKLPTKQRWWWCKHPQLDTCLCWSLLLTHPSDTSIDYTDVLYIPCYFLHYTDNAVSCDSPIHIFLRSYCIGDFLCVNLVDRVHRQLHYEPVDAGVLIDLSDIVQNLQTGRHWRHECVNE